MLIQNAELEGAQRADLRIAQARIVQIAARIEREPGEVALDAQGGALLPGLHDHHLHLYATAAALRSLACGPPSVNHAQQLAAALARAVPGEDGWIRGVGYHASVAGELDATRLDAWVPQHPLRIQHRSGRLWMLNSAGLRRLALRDDDPVERIDGQPSGRVYDADAWLRARIGARAPSLAALSRALARWGITACTDTGQANDRALFAQLAQAHARGEWRQRLRVMGDASLDAQQDVHGVTRGEHKFHLHDHALPDFDTVCAAIRASHAVGRAVAFHCVTRAELVFALGVLREAGSSGRDRIEHGGLVSDELLDELRALRLRVVTQPHFIAERGDAYLRDVDSAEHAELYRLRGLMRAGLPLAAGSDAPYGDFNPWLAMQAAVDRRTAGGARIGTDEALTPEQARDLFLAPLEDVAGPPRRIEVGAPADLCLLDAPWAALRERLGSVAPRWVAIAGETAFSRDHPL